MNCKVKKVIDGMSENPHSFINKGISAEEVAQILECVGSFIRKNLLQNNNVIVQGIGTFALFQQKLPISHHPIKYIMNQSPVFQLSHSLASKFRLKWARKAYEMSLPAKLLNYSLIAFNTGLPRSKVVLAMYDLNTWIERLLHDNENVVLPIEGVGVLTICEDKHKMDFSHQFLKDVTLRDVVHVVEKS